MPLVEEGARAPAFSLRDQNGALHRLTAHRGRPAVVFFYPKDDTATCTQEACAFRDLGGAFTGAGVAVLGISPQDGRSKARFAAKHGLTYPVLADEGAAVCAKYGVWQEKSMYGKTYLGVVRTTYLIRASGAVEKRWDRVRVAGHAEDVLAAARLLGG